MMRIVSLIFLLLYTAPALCARWLDFNWEKIPKANAYELEVTRIKGKERYPLGNFHTKETSFKKKVNPGFYQVRIRSLDSRNVPGPWSEPIEINVDYKEIERYRPQPKEIIANPNAATDVMVHFAWENLEEVPGYQFELFDMNDKTLVEKKTKKNSLHLKVKTGQQYKWRVRPLQKNIDELKTERWPFQVQGIPLPEPFVEIDEESNTIAFTMKHEEKDVKFDFELFKKEKKKRNKVLEKKNYPKNKYNVSKSKISPGSYTLEVQANKTGYPPSYLKLYDFNWDGHRLEKLYSPLFADRSHKKWNFYIQASFINNQYKSHDASRNLDVDTELPTFRFGTHIARRFNFGVLGVGLVSGRSASATNVYTTSQLDLFWGWLNKKWGFVKFNVGNGVFYRSSFVLRGQQQLVTEDYPVTHMGVNIVTEMMFELFETFDFGAGLKYNHPLTTSIDGEKDAATGAEISRFYLKFLLRISGSYDLMALVSTETHKIDFNDGSYSENNGTGYSFGLVYHF